ncbi:MAG: hypothetical protein RID42_05115 [Alphaproteobacteria bacterium]
MDCIVPMGLVAAGRPDRQSIGGRSARIKPDGLGAGKAATRRRCRHKALTPAEAHHHYPPAFTQAKMGQ